MPGKIIFKPIEARLVHNVELIGNMNPYCLFRVGEENFTNQVCKNGGLHPYWGDEVVVPVPTGSKKCTVIVRDDNVMVQEDVGSFVFDVNLLKKSGKEKNWFPLKHNAKLAGSLLLEVCYVDEPIQGSEVCDEAKILPGTFGQIAPEKANLSGE